MKFKLLAGAALAAVFAASGASAQDAGWYGAADLGYHWPHSMETGSANNGPGGVPYNWEFNQSDDWAGFARLGYRLNPNWRVELEGGYRPGDISSVRGAPGSFAGLCTPGVVRTAGAPRCGSPNGDVESWTLMGNVIYDIAPGAVLNPFVGVGVGVNHVKMDVVGQFATMNGPFTVANPSIQNLTIDDDNTALAYQLLAGLAWSASERLNVDLTYRYLGGSDLEFASRGSAAVQPGEFNGDYRDQAVTVGLRYSFAAPPPPPPPPPAPPQAAPADVDPLDSLEAEMARLLGRPDQKE